MRNDTRLIVVSFLLFAVSLFLTSYSAKNPKVGQVGATIALKLFGPGELLYATVVERVSETYKTYLYQVGVRQENEELKGKVRSLEAEVASLEETRLENLRFQELLRIEEQGHQNGIFAQVISRDPSVWSDSVIVNRGSVHGVAPNMPVVSGAGVVGQVIATSRLFSRVLLMTDPASGVDALVRSSRVHGVVEGRGAKLCDFKYVDKNASVKVGELVVTSGLDHVYPKGLVVGVVQNIKERREELFMQIEVSPAVMLKTFEEVLILPPAIDAQDLTQLGPELDGVDVEGGSAS